MTCLIVAEIDVCVLANNHVLDYGPLGLVETLETLGRAGLTGLGGGSAAAARLADVAGWGFLMFFASGEHSTRSVPMCSRHSPNALLFGCLTLVNGVFAVEKGEFVIAGLLMAGGFIAFYVLALSGDQISRRDGMLPTWCRTPEDMGNAREGFRVIVATDGSRPLIAALASTLAFPGPRTPRSSASSRPMWRRGVVILLTPRPLLEARGERCEALPSPPVAGRVSHDDG